MSREDPTLLCSQDAPAENARASVQQEWTLADAKGKSTIILGLGDSALAKTRSFLDNNDSTSKELWEELACIFTMSSNQSVANLHAKMEALVFKDGEDWDKHISTFINIIDELAAQDQVLNDADKFTKLLRSLPPSFDALEMASSLQKSSFDEILSAVQANIERKNKLGTWKQNTNTNHNAGPSAQFAYGRIDNFNIRGLGHGGSRGRGGRGGKGRGGRGGYIRGENSRNCHHCGKSGHFIKFYRLRIADENSGRICKPNHNNHNNNNNNKQINHQNNNGQKNNSVENSNN